MELIIALFSLAVWLACFSMIVIVMVFGVFVLFHGHKYTLHQLWELFKQTTVMTFIFTVVGGALMIGISSVKHWFKD